MALKQSDLNRFFRKRTPEDEEQEPSTSSSEFLSSPITDQSTVFTDKFSCLDRPDDPIQYVNRTLTDNERHHLLEQKWVPDSNFKYQVNEKGRKYNRSWEMNRPWLRYSPSDDSAFCSFCIAFPVSVSETNPEFGKVGFRDWKNAVGDKRGALDKHVKSEIHRLA